MIKLLFLLLFSVKLFSFSLDFSLPPVIEEVFEPSVLGEEVEPIKEKKPTKEQLPTQKENPTTIYVEHKEEIDLSPQMSFATYPKIALLVPKKVIGKYANSIADSILSYLIYKDEKFQFELFDCEDESEAHILQQLSAIRHKGYQLVVAAVTQKGAKIIAANEYAMQVYIPTINKKEIDLMSENITFGGIDYEEQIDKLLSYAADRVVIFTDESALAKKLERYIDNASFSEVAYRKTIKNAKSNLSFFIKKNRKLKNASIFLNMPIVKAALLASQLSVHEAGQKNILLTQISYNPLLFSLTQAKERETMYIANSIGETDFQLKDINMILGTNVDFAWVNYSTLIGVDYFSSHFIEGSGEKHFAEKMVNNQIRYKIDILKPIHARFERVDNNF
jgi:hypothetical protein